MKIKAIIAILLISTSAMAQRKIVSYDGTNLYSAGGSTQLNAIAQGITNYFAPSYAMLAATSSPFKVAGGLVVSNGTISSGSVTNTWVEDSDYLVIDETGVWECYFYFTNTTILPPRILDFHGRYEGTPAHNVKFQAYDFTNSVYSNFTASVDDLPSSTADSMLKFTFPEPAANFYNTNGQSIIKIYHDGVAIGTHQLFVDFLQLTYATGISTNAGDWQTLGGFSVVQSNNITANGTAGTITTTSAGDYTYTWSVAFTGLTNTEFRIRHLTNGTPSGTASIRTIGSQPMIGSMSALGGGRQAAGVTNSWQWSANNDNAYIVFVNGAAQVKKEAK